MIASSNNIIGPFLAAAQNNPDRIALIEGKTKVSYARLLKKVKGKAACFRKKGIGKGDRVLVFVPMSIELYETVLALFYMGATAVFVDEWVNRERLELCCRMAKCKGFIAPAKIRWLALTSKTLRKIPVWLPTGKCANESSAMEIVDPGDTALITFTTGSTGTPKAANRTHAFLYEQFRALLLEIKPTPQDVDLTTLPIVLLLNLGSGCTSVIPSFSSSKPEKTDFEKIAAEIRSYGVNRMESSPDFALRLAQYLIAQNTEVPTLKKVFTGGAPVFPTEAEVLRSAFKNSAINIVYGSTEAEPVSVIDAQTLLQASVPNALPVGKIHPGAKVRILPIDPGPLTFDSAEAFERSQLKHGDVGEIVVSGAHVLTGYIDNAEAEKQNKIWVNGTCWHRTGDSGKLDEEGNLYLCGRAAMVFAHRGINYYPFMVEQWIRESGISAIGTVMLVDGKVVVYAEGDTRQTGALDIYLKGKHLEYDQVVMLKKVPRDKRHFSKIEYGLLKTPKV